MSERMSASPSFEALVTAAERAVLLAQWARVLDDVPAEEWDRLRATAKWPKPTADALERVEAIFSNGRLPGRPQRDPRDKGRLMLFAGRQYAAFPAKLARTACHAWALANTGFSEREIAAYLDLAEKRA